jgi:hypothetical protein
VGKDDRGVTYIIICFPTHQFLSKINEVDGLSPYKDKDSHYKPRSSFHPPFPRVMFCNPFEIFMCLA